MPPSPRMQMLALDEAGQAMPGPSRGLTGRADVRELQKKARITQLTTQSSLDTQLLPDDILNNTLKEQGSS
jgi:hypothetical protein